MDIPEVVRAVTAAGFIVAFFGLSKDMTRRTPRLARTVRRQHTTYYLLVLVVASMVLARMLTGVTFLWVEVALCAVSLLAAFTSNWGLHSEDDR